MFHGLCRRYRRIPLREFLVVPFVLQIGIAVGITGGLSLLNGRKAVNQVASSYRQELTTRIQQELEDFLETPHHLTQLNVEAARSQLLDLEDPQALEDRFFNQIKTFESVDFVYFGSPQGGILSVGRGAAGELQLDLSRDLAAGDYLIYDLDEQGNRLQQERVRTDYDTRQRPWFRNPLAAGEDTWTIYLYINRMTLGLAHSRPLYDPSGELQGVFAADVLLSDLDQFLQDLELKEGGQTFIVERSGEIVASSAAEPPFSESEAGESRLNGLNSQEPLIRATLEHLLQENADLSSITTPMELQFPYGEERQFVQIVPFRAYGLDWLIGVVVPESSFMAQIEENTRWTLVICLAALGLATGVGVWTARRITQPLEQLSYASQSLAQRARTGAITQADLGSTVELNREDEIGTLARSYNQMAYQLQEAFARLKDHTQELERKVEERTAHLEERAQLAALDADIGIALTQGNSLQETLSQCGQAIVDRLDVALVQIWTGLQRDPDLRLQVSLGTVGVPPQWGDSLNLEAQGLALIAQQRCSYLCNQLQTGDCAPHPPIWDLAWVQREGLQAFAAFPLIVEDKVVGILVVMARYPLTEAAQQELASVSHEIALGIRRKQMESALRESEERYRGIVENASDLIVTLTPDSRCRYLSPNLPQVLGYEAEELKGEPWSALIHPDDLPGVSDVAERGITTGETVTTPAHRMRCKNGTWRWFITSGSCVFDNQHTPLYLVCIARDVTDRKQVEAEMQKARDAAVAANRAKSEFLASVSHELRTPLNGILGYAQILKRDQALASGQRQGLDVIQRSGEHLLTLINDILDLSKIEARKMELRVNTFQLPEFLQTVADLFRLRAQQKGIAFLYELITPLPQWVEGDEKRLRQVLMNLLSNAVKFTDQGGVTFKVGVLERESKSELQPRIRFQVQDTGRGIAAADLEEIFLPFQQAGDQRYITEGTGLGLPISQRLVEMMGTEIQVESQPDQGSCFWFDLRLPQVEGSALVEQEAQDPIITGYRGPRRRILVVDDKWENRSVMLNLLTPLGFAVIEASNGQEGLDRALERCPDVVLMDLVMPVMDGFEATRRLRTYPQLEGLVILAASASTFDRDQQSSLDAGCDDFISKPIVASELLQKLETSLHLEWIYSTEASSPPEIWKGTDQEPEPESDLPTPADLSQLWELARIGHIKGILEYLDRLEAGGYGGSEFTEELRRMAKTFQVKKIQTLIKPLIER